MVLNGTLEHFLFFQCSLWHFLFYQCSLWHWHTGDLHNEQSVNFFLFFSFNAVFDISFSVNAIFDISFSVNAVFDIDTLGTFTMSKAAFQGLKACGSGCIINISMTLHYGASWYQTHASAAKVTVPCHSARSSWVHTCLCVMWVPTRLYVMWVNTCLYVSTSILWHHGAKWYPWTLLRTFAICCCALQMPCSVGCALQMPCSVGCALQMPCSVGCALQMTCKPTLLDQSGSWARFLSEWLWQLVLDTYRHILWNVSRDKTCPAHA